MTHPVKKIFIVVVSLLITSCGGDGNSSSTGEVQTGVFWDSPIAGLNYKTATREGTTSADGEFEFLDGELITFSLGKVVLGTAQAAPRISPFDLVPISPPDVGDLDTEILSMLLDDGVTAFEHGVNLLIFLQSLDADDDPDNGIEIPAAVADFFLLIVNAILFEQDNEDFAIAFLALFLEIIEQGLLQRNADAVPVEYTDALIHFYAELGEDIAF